MRRLRAVIICATGDIDGESILANKDQTKLYWETKMLDAQNAGNNNDIHHSSVYNSKASIHPAKMEAPLSPPPGFESPREAQHNGHFLQSTDEFVEVGSIIVEDDNESDVTLPEHKAVDDVIHYDPPPVEKVMQRSVDKVATRRMPETYFNDVHTDNPQETLIEREIRQQREREEALARERELALQMLQAAQNQKQQPKEVKKEASPAPVATPVPVAAPALTPAIRKDTRTPKKSSPVAESKSPRTEDDSVNYQFISSAELRISEEIRELRRREEELRILREANARNAQNLNHEQDDDRQNSIPFTDEGYDDPDSHSDGRDASSDSNNRYFPFSSSASSCSRFHS